MGVIKDAAALPPVVAVVTDCDNGKHADTRARVGHDINWWQCTDCGRLERMSAAEIAEWEAWSRTGACA